MLNVTDGETILFFVKTPAQLDGESEQIIPKKIYKRVKLSVDFLMNVDYNSNQVEFGDSDQGFLINPYL